MAENEPTEDERQSRADAVRAAATQAIEAAAGQAGLTRERAQQLAEDLVQAMGRVRGAVEDLRPAAADDVKALREQVAALEVRVAALETATRGAMPSE